MGSLAKGNAFTFIYSKVPPVPETILKKRKRSAEIQARLKKHIPKVRKARAAKRRVIFKKAEKYVREYRQKEKEEIRLNRLAKQHNNFYVPAQPKLALVIRIRG